MPVHELIGWQACLQGDDGLCICQLAGVCAQLIALDTLQRCLNGSKGVLPVRTLQPLHPMGLRAWLGAELMCASLTFL